MTETDWLTGRTTPMAMCHHIEKSVSMRKFRLLAAQVCRTRWSELTPSSQHAIISAERSVENPEDDSAHDAFNIAADTLRDEHIERQLNRPGIAVIAAVASSQEFLSACIHWIQEDVPRKPEGGRRHSLDQLRSRICDLFREVVGNPFRPWKAVPAFLDGGVLQPDGQLVRLTGTSLGLAEAIHQLQAFDRLPILADALEESGVSDPEILAHCRDATHHVRGCWALDVVRGKS